MSTEVTLSHEDDVLMVGAFNSPTSYFLWQYDTDEVSEVFFEYDDQANGGYNNISKCHVNQTGMQIVTTSNQQLDFQFSKLTDKAQSKLLAGLKDIYSNFPSVLTIDI